MAIIETASAQTLQTILPELIAGFRSRLGLETPYCDEGGIPGELYGMMDLDEVFEDPALPAMRGRAATRLAFVAQGPLVLTTFIADSNDFGESQSAAQSLFLTLADLAIEQIPQIGQDIGENSWPCLIREVKIANNRFSRVLLQHRRGGTGSNWTLHLVGQIEVAYIVARYTPTREHLPEVTY